MKYLKLQTIRSPGGAGFFSLVWGRNSRQHIWTLQATGAAWAYWQTAAKEGREILARLKGHRDKR